MCPINVLYFVNKNEDCLSGHVFCYIMGIKLFLNYFQAIQNKRKLYQMEELVQRLSKLIQVVAVEIWIYLPI